MQGKISLLLIIVLLIAGTPAVLATTDTSMMEYSSGTISVTSYPSGAAVYLNGNFHGITPVEIYNLPEGQYSVMATLAGYKTESLPVVLWAGHIREITFSFQPTWSVSPTPAAPVVTPEPLPVTGSGSIAVDSTPGEAYVYLDGAAVGWTPVTHAALILNNVPAGTHTIRVELPGYLPFTSSVFVTQNQVSRINADMSLRSQPVVTTEPTLLPQQAPTQQSGLPPAIIIGALGLVGIAAVFRRS